MAEQNLSLITRMNCTDESEQNLQRIDSLLGQVQGEKHDLQAVDKDGFNILHKAAQAGSLNIVRKLLEHTPVEKKDEFIMAESSNSAKLNAFHLAVCQGHESMAKYLLDQVSANKKDKLIMSLMKGLEMNALHVAVLKRQHDMIAMLLREATAKAKENLVYPLKNQSTPLHFAVLLGLTRAVTDMLACVSDERFFRELPKPEANSGLGLLHMASMSTYEMFKCIIDRSDDIVKKSSGLRKEMNSSRMQGLVNQRNKNGVTPIHLAALLKRDLVLDALLKQLPLEKQQDALDQNDSNGKSTIDFLDTKQEGAVAILAEVLYECLRWKVGIGIDYELTQDIVPHMLSDFLMSPDFLGAALLFGNNGNSNNVGSSIGSIVGAENVIASSTGEVQKNECIEKIKDMNKDRPSFHTRTRGPRKQDGKKDEDK